MIFELWVVWQQHQSQNEEECAFCLASNAKYRGAFNKIWKPLDWIHRTRVVKTANKNNLSSSTANTTTTKNGRGERKKNAASNEKPISANVWLSVALTSHSFTGKYMIKVFPPFFSFFHLFVWPCVCTIFVGNLSSSPTNSFSLFWHVCLFYFMRCIHSVPHDDVCLVWVCVWLCI